MIRKVEPSQKIQHLNNRGKEAAMNNLREYPGFPDWKDLLDVQENG